MFEKMKPEFFQKRREICLNSVTVHHVLSQNLIRGHFHPHCELITTWQVKILVA